MRRCFHTSSVLLTALLLARGFALPAFAQSSLSIRIDASEAPRRMLRAHLSIPVSSGPLTLVYPKWIPGEHAPSGPITDLAGLRFAVSGKEIVWRRDALDMFAFHLEIPAGAHELEATLSYLSPPAAEGFSSGSSATAQLAIISWNQLLLYPRGAKTRDLLCDASLVLPKGWGFGTALEVRRVEAGRVDFKPASLARLVDSPVLAGSFFKTIDLSPGSTIPYSIDLAADSAAALEMSHSQIGHYRRLIAETLALFGAGHYSSYHFLLALSDHVAHFGLEHHESSDNRTWERALLEDRLRKLSADLLPHELVHSWNGKYRQPAGMTTEDFDAAMNTDLLWVYEGLTQYLGDVLAVRSGLWSTDDYRQYLALAASNLELSSGRRWRPLADTAIAAQLLYSAREDFASFRRAVDFYDEGALIWLEADTLIRKQSGGEKSIEAFCRAFFGPPGGSAEVKPYTMSDLIDALTGVAPYDWSGFFTERVQPVTAHAPLNGIYGSGWKIDYSEEIPPMLSAMEEVRKTTYLTASLGLTVKEDGTILDVDPDMPAWQAGLAPGMKLVEVNGRPYSPLVLRSALKEGKRAKDPIELLADNAGFTQPIRLDYHGGEKYPSLVRDSSRPDLLGQILQPLAAH